MSAQSVDKLVYMANQIARNLVFEADPVTSVADHIEAFWSPRMKTMIEAADQTALEPIACEAIARLIAGAKPEHQTRATDPHAHGSDAG